MNQTIQDLWKICEAYRFRDKLLFVPSYSIGHQLGEDLARKMGSWINLRMTTVAGFAQELVGTDLSKEGIRLIDSHEILLIIEEILEKDAASDRMGVYFEGAKDIPGIIRCLANTINELRMAGLGPEDIEPKSFLVPQKAQEIVSLLDTYEAFLSETGRIDRAGLIIKAIQTLQDSKPSNPERIVMVLSDFPLMAIEKNLIRMVGGEDLQIVRHSRPVGLDVPTRFFKADKKVKEEDIEPKADIQLLSWLNAPQNAPLPFGDGTVTLFHALGESNEVREVFRRILSRGLTTDDVEILVTKTDPYVSLIHEIASSLDIPITFSAGIPITYTRPGRALMLYFKWQAENFASQYLQRLFSGGYLDLNGILSDEDGPSPGKAAAIIRDAGIGWGRKRYADRLEALEKQYLSKADVRRENGEEEKAQWEEKKAAQTRWVLRVVDHLLSSISQETPEETVTLEQVCRGAVTFLDKFCRVAGEMDAVARNRLMEVLSELAQSPGIAGTAGDKLKRMIEITSGMSIGHSNPKPGHTHVSHYCSGGYSGRSHTFVLGLDQAKFPGALLQDPLILDSERTKLGPALPLSGQLLDENLYVISKVLCSLEGDVSMSYSCRDLLEERELFPSSILLSAYRLINGDREGNYRDLRQFLGQPAGFVPIKNESCLNDTEWWLFQKDLNYGSDSVLTSYGHLGEGEQAEAGRESDLLTEYDGWLESFKGALDPLKSNRAMSCSRLEELAKCPFAFFIHHVLGIEPLEDLEKDPGRWLDPLQRGTLLHDVFCFFMTELKSKNELPDFQKHVGLIERIGMEEVEKWKKTVPPPSELTFDREVEDIRLTLEIFLRNEVRRCSTVTPEWFELSFGISWGDQCGEVFKEPVEIPLNERQSFKLSGRIDRIDRVGDHTYEVWDYKTGGSFGFKEEGYLNQGRHLQHALYAIATEILLRKTYDEKAQVVRSGYFFPSPKGEGQRIVKIQSRREELFTAMGDFFELFRTGIFPATYDKGGCRFCDYVKVCGGEEVAVKHTVRKMRQDEKMAPLRRLKDYA
ncbi:MAG: PD-(D/E)XK nuclease family protein [Deltaproteobacteria bacterium]|nr:PD-(D/E)XK nuclease family protein [Deltaproteobacteria bacterium]